MRCSHLLFLPIPHCQFCGLRDRTPLRMCSPRLPFTDARASHTAVVALPSTAKPTLTATSRAEAESRFRKSSRDLRRRDFTRLRAMGDRCFRGPSLGPAGTARTAKVAAWPKGPTACPTGPQTGGMRAARGPPLHLHGRGAARINKLPAARPALSHASLPFRLPAPLPALPLQLPFLPCSRGANPRLRPQPASAVEWSVERASVGVGPGVRETRSSKVDICPASAVIHPR